MRMWTPWGVERSPVCPSTHAHGPRPWPTAPRAQGWWPWASAATGCARRSVMEPGLSPLGERARTHQHTGTQTSPGTDHSKGSLREAGHRASRLGLGWPDVQEQPVCLVARVRVGVEGGGPGATCQARNISHGDLGGGYTHVHTCKICEKTHQMGAFR